MMCMMYILSLMFVDILSNVQTILNVFSIRNFVTVHQHAAMRTTLMREKTTLTKLRECSAAAEKPHDI